MIVGKLLAEWGRFHAEHAESLGWLGACRKSRVRRFDIPVWGLSVQILPLNCHDRR